MDAPALASTPTESERETKSLGRVIFDRIGTLERTRLQTKCLQMLSATPVWNQLVFRGAVAIHGVHLHGRCSRDLDFLAPPEVKDRFVEILAQQGIQLQQKEDARIPHFPMQGTVFKDIAVGIDVCTREVADDFKNAGVALADGEDGNPYVDMVKIKIPRSCEDASANCDQCMSDMNAACQVAVLKKRNLSGALALAVCQKASEGCKMAFCMTDVDDAPGFAGCYEKALKKV